MQPGRESNPETDEPNENVEGFLSPLVSTEVHFTDDFAPSHTELAISDPDILKSPQARFTLHNRQISDTISDAVAFAILLGFPKKPYLELAFCRTTEEEYQEVLDLIEFWVPRFEECSAPWLKLRVYFEWFQACHDASAGASLPFLLQAITNLGATARELELAALNKADALSRRKQKRALLERNEGRDQYNSDRQAQAEEWKGLAASLARQTKRSGNARAEWVARVLHTRHGLQRSTKTVANFLREIDRRQK
jgi:hypothetical protein